MKSLRVMGKEGVTLNGLALIDQRDSAFQSFVITPQGQFRLAYSGDVKIYENTTVLPRAFFVSNVLSAADDDEAVQLMRAETFDPAKQAVIEDGGNEGQRDGGNNLSTSPSLHPAIVFYSPEHVTIDVNAPQDGYLVLTDAYDPGWTATVDGQPAEIERADLMFRAVKIPAGQHRVEFGYQPQSFAIGAAISIGTVVLLAGMWFSARRRNKSRML